jgi:dipeptidyl aminopeptidase/acylaminoacyl peptidase
MVVAPYGTWKSPVTADAAAAGSVRPAFPIVEGDAVWWIEGRPSEEGRYALMRREEGGEPLDVLPPPWSVRTLVHEYGGRCHAVAGSTVWFVNFADQRVYRHDTEGGGEPSAVTPEPPEPRAWRYADLVLTPDRRHLLCVRERHEAGSGDVVNDLAAIPADGSGPPVQIAGGHDFFAYPAPHPSGRRLAWVAWDHPRMPWDGTLLYEAALGEDLSLGEARLVAGDDEESVVQPAWSPDGRLHFVSDRTGWWNLYADDGAAGEPVAPMEAELASAAWLCGMRDYGFLDDGRILARWQAGGTDHLGVVSAGNVVETETPFTAIETLDVRGRRGAFVGASGSLSRRIVSFDVDSAAVTVLRETGAPVAGEEWISLPQPIDPPLADGGTTHALWYAPRSPDHEAPAGELPPVIVASHGGPTAASPPILDWTIQYWTSRGIGVVAVNYGGSTGYGRDYRERLRGRWGVVDLDDCVATVRWLAEQGLADPARLLVHGGSAGGYTTLCALAFRDDVFAAGASYYGVADLRALAEDTHKFESRYLDGLVGPWPQARDVYEERSPVLHADRLRTPMILFQGLEDKVVPPAQAEVMVEALRRRGVPFAYVAYEGEQHGFRQAANIRRTIEAELSFYGRVLGFEPADDIEPVEIEHAEALRPAG